MEVAKLSLEPDDTLVIRVASRLTTEMQMRLNEVMKRTFPGRKVMVVDPGTEFLVLRPRPDSPMSVIRPEPMKE